ncbi:hypothetical protein J6590_053963 [Homalodisca vitripennis]|nr:hypothetical protein J6590_053963 [Homalodisca vitripennis]
MSRAEQAPSSRKWHRTGTTVIPRSSPPSPTVTHAGSSQLFYEDVGTPRQSFTRVTASGQHSQSAAVYRLLKAALRHRRL